MPASFQLVLLPGLGADWRLFEPQRRVFPQIIVPWWIPPRRKESLPDYAARMSETITPTRDSPLVLGGVSFGGMLAYEMARRLRPAVVVLIASCRARRGLRPIYRLGRGLLPLIPPIAWSIPKLLAAPAMRLSSRIPGGQGQLIVEMFKEMDNRFMHWIVGALLDWRPTPLNGIPVRQIHGLCDLLIPARRVDADEYVPGGGHMINVTHAEKVNEFIAQSVVS
ncbi:MAG: alpha/beta hydrolase [Pirellulales bacterium]|nr:alpha/beta hydrolase [Pirellulales bacterium]